jgi:hypothetical protein
MQEASRFVSEVNIATFTARLYDERNPAKRKELQRMLLEQEDRFGEYTNRLEVVQRYIRESTVRIDIQRHLIAKMEAAGYDVSQAIRALENSAQVRDLLHQYRASIMDRLDRHEL